MNWLDRKSVGIRVPESQTIMVASSQKTGQTENNTTTKLWRCCVVVSAETGKSTIKQTKMHTLVCSCHCGTVIYFTSPVVVVVVVPYCQHSWCLCGNLCKSRVQLWHLKTANAHGACSCHKLLYAHIRMGGKHMLYKFFVHIQQLYFKWSHMQSAKLFNQLRFYLAIDRWWV